MSFQHKRSLQVEVGDKNGEIVKYKASYVAKGVNQVFGSGSSKTFSPTAELSSIRMFLAPATPFRCEVFQLDVSSAYLNVDKKEDVFVEQPPGCEVPRKGSNLVCKFLKGLFGFKEAGRCWERTLNKFLTVFGLTRSMLNA